MKNTHHFFAFDLGATSGRSILGTLKDGKLELKELTRFPNQLLRIGDKYYWNIYSLFQELKAGLVTAKAEGYTIDAIGIDTWGVDFVYLMRDGSFAGLPRSYRDPYTNGMPEKYFEIIPRKEVYEKTGIEIMNFNSLFQLFAARQEGSAALDAAESLLFMPDALSYLLTGKKVCEYSIASTSQLLNPRTKQFESTFLRAIGLPDTFMQPIVMPGTIIGTISESIQKECGIDSTAVVAVAGHDTASAVAAVPAENERFAYLSSGTWSLMGIEVKEPIITPETFELNFTNEGGVEGTTRFLKNITGMWLLEQCRKEWEKDGTVYTYPEIVELSQSVEHFRFLIDPGHPGFANPEKMTGAIAKYCKDTNQEVPKTHADFIGCIFDSLALKYKETLTLLQQVAPFTIEKLHVIGGGSQNRLLNQATANATGIPVIAGPAEATAIGNMMMQAKGLGLVDSLEEIRKIVRRSVQPETFLPEETGAWNAAFEKFKRIILIVILCCLPGLLTAQQLIPVTEGYSRTSVNTAIFRNNSVVSFKNHQYISFYDAEGWIIVGKRKLNSKDWELKKTQYQGNCQDAHNVISMMVDGRGFIHLSFDHHGHPLRYCRSTKPETLEFGELQPMVGNDEHNVTYPEFYRMSNGDLLFAYRSGASGRGNLVLNRYILKTQQWERVQDVLIDGEDQRNAYWQLYVDPKDNIHLSWVWREHWYVETNHDLCYAKSSDGGKTWMKSNGEKYTLPINAGNAEYAWLIPQKSELINQTSMTADKNGNPYIATYWRDQDSDIPQYRLVWFDGKEWKQQQVSQRETAFSLSGGGTKRIPIARPRLVIDQKKAWYIFRDEERGSKVSVAYAEDINSGQWEVKDLTSFPVDAWEPSHDSELWKKQQKLHLFVQRTEQGDGERVSDMPPQMVYVLEY